MAARREVEIVAVGDKDAFTGDFEALKAEGFAGVVVVHPAAAMRASAAGLSVGVFENGSRPVEGGKPAFFAKSFWIFA